MRGAGFLASVERREWFERQIEALRPALLLHALKMCHSQDLAQDIVAQSVLQGWRSLDTFTNGSGDNFRAWMYRIVTNTAINVKRKNGRVSTVELDSVLEGSDGSEFVREVADNAPGPERRLFDGVLSERVHKALFQVPADYREPLVMVFIEGASYKDVAEKCGIPVGTVRSRLHRGVEKFKAAYASGSDEPTIHALAPFVKIERDVPLCDQVGGKLNTRTSLPQIRPQLRAIVAPAAPLLPSRGRYGPRDKRVDWEGVRKALANGASHREAAKQFGTTHSTVKYQASVQGWEQGARPRSKAAADYSRKHSAEVWSQVKVAYESGASCRAAGEPFGVPQATVYKRSRLEGWSQQRARFSPWKAPSPRWIGSKYVKVIAYHEANGSAEEFLPVVFRGDRWKLREVRAQFGHVIAQAVQIEGDCLRDQFIERWFRENRERLVAEGRGCFSEEGVAIGAEEAKIERLLGQERAINADIEASKARIRALENALEEQAS